ncbi:MAG: V-type ATP synthase subunit D [Bacteroidota bacterium]
MALKFQYNKITIQSFRRQLAIRQRALPILQNKETALRKEVKTLTYELLQLEAERESLQQRLDLFEDYWTEFPKILGLRDLGIQQKSVVGVKIPEINEIQFYVEDVPWWRERPWVPSGMDVLKKAIELDLQVTVMKEQIELLHQARKKTTQKVNLYEKVQIPQYEDAIIKIKRFLEDRENISKAAQKIMKKRKEVVPS